MILTCPHDAMVLDLGAWQLLSLDITSGDSIYLWPRCADTTQPPHWVMVTWRGKTPHIQTGPITAVTPAKSHLPNRGISPSPLDIRPRVTVQPKIVPVKSSAPPMVIRRR